MHEIHPESVAGHLWRRTREFRESLIVIVELALGIGRPHNLRQRVRDELEFLSFELPRSRLSGEILQCFGRLSECIAVARYLVSKSRFQLLRALLKRPVRLLTLGVRRDIFEAVDDAK
nr:hypothetical protein [Caballeronia zhejiangensis]